MGFSAHAAELCLTLSAAHAASPSTVGDKAGSLGVLLNAGAPVVDGIVLSTDAYRAFVEFNGLRAIAEAEIDRRARVQARAEEYWDSSQRIRAAFVAAPWPGELREAILAGLEPVLGGPVVVRSSAAHAAGSSRPLTRMYDSLVGVVGAEATLVAIKVVWASLFSDRALLYGAEIGLDSATSAMAVIVGPMVDSRAAAVVFTRHPLDHDHTVVEAVHGPGEGLASGSVEPHRWVLDRESGAVLEHIPPTRIARGAVATDLPLNDDEVADAWRIASLAERLFGEPQACEFVLDDGGLHVVESRGISQPPSDERSAYVAARLPESRLEDRRSRVETEYLPSMWSEANALSVVGLANLSDDELCAEASRRAEAVAHWRHVYRTVLAPFAHGQRLFGEYYVRMLAPVDPFEFISLLVRTPAEYEQRRQILAELGIEPPDAPRASASRDGAEAVFLAAVPDVERNHARRLLDLARASWRTRDDDNLYLDRIDSEALRALAQIEERLEAAPGDAHSVLGPASRTRLTDAAEELRGLELGEPAMEDAEEALAPGERPLEMAGDPASPGVGRGRARLARDVEDARLLQPGEVLVVDSLQPAVTAYAARATAIVERRGGMFAHGAVLAREHGLPCVTGVCEALTVIHDAELLVVDGDRGVVVLEGS